jgi:hypothetical protein
MYLSNKLFRLPANVIALTINNAIQHSYDYGDPKNDCGFTSVISKDWFIVLSSSGEGRVSCVVVRKFKFDEGSFYHQKIIRNLK